MKFCVLGSGSKGNCTLIEAGKTTLLIDAGFSGKEIKRRLALIDRTPEMISAILVTHEHNDHIGGVGVLSRRYKLPVYANPATHRAAEKRVGELAARMEFGTGEKFTVDGLRVHPFSVSHDTADPVGFVITDGFTSVGYCTDTGRVTKLILHHLRRCRGLILEANHDPRMLMEGPYPLPLKQRVQSSQGHLANGDAAGFVAELAGGVLRSLVLAHLSETNNHPDLVEKAIRDTLGTTLAGLTVTLARQDRPGQVIDIG